MSQVRGDRSMWRDLAPKFERNVFAISSYLTKIGAIISLPVMVMLTVVDVTMRYCIRKGVLGAYEIVEYAMVVLVFSALGHAQATGMNVKVDVLYDRLSRRARVVFDAVNSLVALVLYCLFVYAAVLQTVSVHRVKLTSGVLFIPTYPFVAWAAVGLAGLCLVLLKDVLMSMGRLFCRDSN